MRKILLIITCISSSSLLSMETQKQIIPISHTSNDTSSPYTIAGQIPSLAPEYSATISTQNIKSPETMNNTNIVPAKSQLTCLQNFSLKAAGCVDIICCPCYCWLCMNTLCCYDPYFPPTREEQLRRKNFCLLTRCLLSRYGQEDPYSPSPEELRDARFGIRR